MHIFLNVFFIVVTLPKDQKDLESPPGWVKLLLQTGKWISSMQLNNLFLLKVWKFSYSYSGYLIICVNISIIIQLNFFTNYSNFIINFKTLFFLSIIFSTQMYIFFRVLKHFENILSADFMHHSVVADIIHMQVRT